MPAPSPPRRKSCFWMNRRHNIDPQGKFVFMKFSASLAGPKTVLMVSHDLSLAEPLTGIAIVNNGVIVTAPGNTLSPELLAALYGAHSHDCALNRYLDAISGIGGEAQPPQPGSPFKVRGDGPNGPEVTFALCPHHGYEIHALRHFWQGAPGWHRLRHCGHAHFGKPPGLFPGRRPRGVRRHRPCLFLQPPRCCPPPFLHPWPQPL